MLNKKQGSGSHSLYQAMARSYYRRAFWTAGAPALILFSLLCGLFGRNGGAIAYLSVHWVIGPLALLCIVGLACFAVADVWRGVRWNIHEPK